MPLHRLHTLGWQIDGNNSIVDHLGQPFDLFSNWNDVKERLQAAWLQVVAAQVGHRPSFKHFHLVNPIETRSQLKLLDNFDQGIMRNLHTGVMLTRDQTYHWTEHGIHECEECGSKDSLSHRFWHCPATEKLRMQLPADIIRVVPSLPEVLSVHGWSLSSPWQLQRETLLDGIPNEIPPTPQVDDSVVDLFTDGSCLWPTNPEFRVAAWSIVVAKKPHLQSSALDSTVLGVGHLPGRCQTAFRAELYAVVVSLHWVLEWQVPTRIWIDCQGVIDHFYRITKGRRKCLKCSANGDLWETVRTLMLAIQVDVQLIKVDAHLSWDSETPELTRWARIHNACADRAAGVANQQRSEQFWRIWQQHSEHTIKANYLGNCIRSHQLRVCKFWNEQFPSDIHPQVVQRQPKRGREFPLTWQAGRIEQTPPQMIKMFGGNYAEKLVSWWNSIIQADQTPDRWISFAQLYVIYQQDMQHPGVSKQGRRWVDPDQYPLTFPENLPFRKRCRFFRLSLQQLWKFCGFQIGVATTRPFSEVLCCHIGCAAVPICLDRVSQLETWFRKNIVGTIAGLGKDLGKIPAV